MINLIVRGVFEHSTKVETMIKQIDKKKFARYLYLFMTIYSMSKMIKQHDERIDNIEKELKEMKLKGE